MQPPMFQISYVGTSVFIILSLFGSSPFRLQRLRRKFKHTAHRRCTDIGRPIRFGTLLIFFYDNNDVYITDDRFRTWIQFRVFRIPVYNTL